MMCLRAVTSLALLCCSLICSTSYALDTKNDHAQFNIANIAIDDDSANVDKILAQYNSSKNDKYLIQLLEYLNSDEFMLIVAYENINRIFNCNLIAQLEKNSSDSEKSNCYQKNYDELRSAIESKYPNAKDKMVKKMDATTKIFFILDENRKNNKEFDKAVRKIITTHPKLNYVKTIEKIILGKS